MVGKEEEEVHRRRGSRGRERGIAGGGASLLSWRPTPLSPSRPAPARTLDQQPEALGAAEEGDGGHGGLTDVGARRVEGDGAQRECGAGPQRDGVLAGRGGRGGAGVRVGWREGSQFQGLGTPFLLTLVQRRAGVGRPCTEQFTAVLLPRCKESSSPVLSSRGSRSGEGYRLSPSLDPHPCG